jgi:hypothetical protein
MNRPYHMLTRNILIGDPNPKRFAMLQQILKSDLGVEAHQANNFDELSKHASEQSRWQFILVADTLPLSSIRPNVILQRYFMSLAQKWSNRLGCIVTTDRDPDLTGIQHQPFYLRFRPGSTPTTIAELAETVESSGQPAVKDLNRQLIRLDKESREQKPTLDWSGYRSKGSRCYTQLEMIIMLAEITRLNESIPHDRNELEDLKMERQKCLTALAQILERL